MSDTDKHKPGVYEAEQFYHVPTRQPWCCPVCHGRGTVQPGFYNPWGSAAMALFERCRSCKGLGYVVV